MTTLYYIIHTSTTKTIVELDHIPTQAEFPDMTGWTGPFKTANQANNAARRGFNFPRL